MANSRSHENALKGHMVNLAGGIKCKLGYISKFCEHTHVCIGVNELVDLSTGSRGGVSSVCLPNAKIGLCVTDQKASFRDGKRMPYWGRCFRGGELS